mmetsp:Transcript_77373/g.129856  ORF Transcript_77373/g.129856 Transcript_77373/m.129856 type:complete len:210 (+) Transcript_77373:458-1087(+)
MFSPILATAAFTTSPTVWSVSLMKGCSRSATSLTRFAIRPSTIFSRMFSGLDCRSSFPISMARSWAKNAGSTSSGATTVTDSQAATCIARSATSSLNASPRATKSVSQLTSMSTPKREPGWMYDPTAPSAAMRPAFLSALARPFLRSHSAAASTSPPFSCSAFLQSIIPAPETFRSADTSFAEMATLGFSSAFSSAFSSFGGAGAGAFI